MPSESLWTKSSRARQAHMLTADVLLPGSPHRASKSVDTTRMPQREGTPMAHERRPPRPVDAVFASPRSLLAAFSTPPKTSGRLPYPHEEEDTLHIPAGRPRASTAPSSPRFDTQTVLVELPGCFPSAVLPSTSVFDDRVTPASRKPSTRPQNSPRVRFKRQVTRERATSPRPSIDASSIASSNASTDNQSEYNTPSSVTDSAVRPNAAMRAAWRQSLALQPPKIGQPLFTAVKYNEQMTSRTNTPQHDDVESTLLSQISALRSSHETHIRSLKCAHDNEVASHLAYIAFLERRQLERAQNLDSRLASSRSGSDASSVSAASSSQSLESVTMIAKESVTEVESLRRKLSVVHKEQAEYNVVRKERDQLREALEQREQRVLQLKTAAKRAAESDEMLRQSVANLEFRLAQANSQRLDVLEGFNVACNTLSALSRTRSREELAKCIEKSIPKRMPSTGTYRNAQAKEEVAKAIVKGSDVSKLEALEASLKERDEKIAALQQALAEREEAAAHSTAQLESLHGRLDAQHAVLAQTEEEKHQYQALLQKEVRRQTRSSTISISASPSIGAQVTSRVQQIRSRAKTTLQASQDNTQTMSTLLEKELELCISEIIMYKLDVRGYRKDLKEAKSQIAELQAKCTPRITTEPASATADDSLANIVHDGLGITISVPPTTPPMRAHEVGETLLPVAATTPLHRPTTPNARSRKPVRSPGLSPSPQLFATGSPRSIAGTVCSATDSIIVSYTQRATPELRCAELVNMTSMKAESPMMVKP